MVKSPGGAVLPSGLDPRVEDLVMQLPRQRSWAFGQLVGAGDLAEPAMIALLASKNLDELQAALDWFVETGRPSGIDGIVPVLEHPIPTVRQRALEALAVLSAKEYAPEVARRVDDADPTVRARAIETLSRLDPEEARRVLMPKLEDPDEEVAVEAALALGRVASPELASELTRLAGSDHPVTAAAALLAARLARTTLPAATVEGALHQRDVRLAQAAARAIALTPPEAQAVLWDKALRDPRLDVRRSALEARVEHDPATAMPLLSAAARATEPELRATAANLLGVAGPEGQRAALVAPLLADPDPAVRRAAVARMGQIDEAGAVDALVARLSTETEASVLELLPRSLALRKDMRAVEPLVAMLEAGKATAETSLALAVLTGRTLGQRPEAWKQYLAERDTEPPSATAGDPAPTEPGAP